MITLKDEIEREIRKTLEDLKLKDTELVHFGSAAKLPTQFGEFQIIGLLSLRDKKEHVILMRGDAIGKDNVPIRIHSECLTGDAFASLRCDCREQLEATMNYLTKQEFGLLIYLRQEGRGIGLFNNIKAYTLQDLGHNTNKANELLGFRADERSYLVAVDILEALKIKSLKLISNNPKKVTELCNSGIEVTERIPIAITPNIFNAEYLSTKSESGHLMKSESLNCQDEEKD